jgi:peptide/nickel transport system permease protein
VISASPTTEGGSTEDVFRHPAHPYTEGLLASLPRNVRRTGRLPSIPGVVPPPSAWPVGCHFADRCPYARPQCLETPVELSARGDDRATRCVRAGELTLAGVGDVPNADEPAPPAAGRPVVKADPPLITTRIEKRP